MSSRMMKSLSGEDVTGCLRGSLAPVVMHSMRTARVSAVRVTSTYMGLGTKRGKGES